MLSHFSAWKELWMTKCISNVLLLNKQLGITKKYEIYVSTGKTCNLFILFKIKIRCCRIVSPSEQFSLYFCIGLIFRIKLRHLAFFPTENTWCWKRSLHLICTLWLSSKECFDVPPNIWEILPKLQQTFQNHHQHNILPEMQRVKQFKVVRQKGASTMIHC